MGVCLAWRPGCGWGAVRRFRRAREARGSCECERRVLNLDLDLSSIQRAPPRRIQPSRWRCVKPGRGRKEPGCLVVPTCLPLKSLLALQDLSVGGRPSSFNLVLPSFSSPINARPRSLHASSATSPACTLT